MNLLRRFFIGAEHDREKNQEKQAVWLKDKLIQLGPTFIKIGQAMATRADLLPLPFVVELGTLVDQVPPFPNDIAFARIEHELGKKINEVYAEFELDPVAAASLGQVYRARLHTGEEVAVKVQRPNLAAVIKGDVEILKSVAKFAERFPQLNENADWAGMLREFDVTIHEEMDYAAEARNADRFRENFKNWTNVYVPKIFWNATTGKVLTMEFIHVAFLDSPFIYVDDGVSKPGMKKSRSDSIHANSASAPARRKLARQADEARFAGGIARIKRPVGARCNSGYRSDVDYRTALLRQH